MLAAYGTQLGTVTIEGCNLDVFSNGRCDFVSRDHSVDQKGNYLGIRFQCVELVRRYCLLRYGVNLAILWSAGDAKDWGSSHQDMRLIDIAPDRVMMGDILTFQGGDWGHVGLVRGMGGDGVSMVSQNFHNAARDLDVSVSSSCIEGSEPLLNHKGQAFWFEGFFRYQPDRGE